MIQLLAWYNLLFYIPLICGLLLGAGTLVGLGLGHGDGHAGADAGHAHATTGPEGSHAGSHAAANGSGHGPGSGPGSGPGNGSHAEPQTVLSHVFELLGLGRVPLSISLMMILLIFGGTGTALNLTLAERLAQRGGYAWGSLGGALLAVLLLSGPMSRLLSRLVPSVETYPVSRRDLIGCTAVLLNDTDEQGGYAQARDREGNVHNISCRTYGPLPGAAPGQSPSRGSLARGTQVLIVDFDPASNRYAVELGPQDPIELAAAPQKRPRRVATRS